MERQRRDTVDRLLRDYQEGRVSRRGFVERGAALGLGLPVIGALLLAKPRAAVAQDAAPARNLAKGVEFQLRSFDDDGNGLVDHNDWPIQKLPGFDRLYDVIEEGEPALGSPLPIDTLWLGRRIVDNTDNQIAANKYPGATIFYLDTLAGLQGAASLELTHHQDSTGFGRLETADGTLSFVDPGESAQLQPGDAIFLVDATYSFRVVNASAATLWMAGLGAQLAGTCGGRPCP